MSTRAHIQITDGDETVMLYHHFDGYPDGIGRDLKRYLNDRELIGEKPVKQGITTVVGPCELATDIIRDGVEYRDYDGKLKYDKGYELTTCVHGDEEYIYYIDLDERTLRCVAARSNKEVEIPD